MPITDDQSFNIRDMMFNALYKPALFDDAATILQYWYNNPSEIKANIDIETYAKSIGGSTTADDSTAAESKLIRRQTDVTEETEYEDPNFDPSQKFDTERELLAITCLDSESHLRPATSDFYEQLYSTYLDKSKYAGDVSLNTAGSCAPWQNTPSQTWNGIRWSENAFKIKGKILFVATPFDPVTPKISGQTAKTYYQGARYVPKAEISIKLF